MGYSFLCTAQAYRWARSHLPPTVPSSFLHGDLLGQNILLGLEEPSGPATTSTLIDWEFACRGDPAYDLAIVTQGTRRPFQVNRGLERLLEFYARPRPPNTTVESAMRA